MGENAAELRSELDKGLSPRDRNQTFGTAANAWLAKDLRGVSDRTLRWYRGIVNNQLKELHNKKLIDLDATDLQRILNRMAQEEKPYAKRTIASVRQVAISVMDYAITKDVVARNKFDKKQTKIPSTVSEPNARQPLTPDQERLVTTQWKNHRMGVPALIMYLCGLRRGELLALQWGDIDFEKKELSVRKAVSFYSNDPQEKKPKTKAGERTIEIPEALVEPLKHQKKKYNSLYVCPNADGGQMSEIAWRRSWESYQHYLNIAAGGRDKTRSNPKVIAMQPFTAHQLRHTYATMLYDAGVDLKKAQEKLGHNDVETTMGIYTHIAQQRGKESEQKLNDYLSRKMQGIL